MESTPQVNSNESAPASGGMSIPDKVKAYEGSFYLWTPTDDFLLKEAMIAVGDYTDIARNVRFAHNFCPEEIEARWLALLYHPVHARDAAARLALLPKSSEQVAWSEGEEEILRALLLRQCEVDFQEILENYRTQFHCSRTARSLQAHADVLKRLHRLGTDEFVTVPHRASPLPNIVSPKQAPSCYFKATGMQPDEIEVKGSAGEGIPFPLVEFVESRDAAERKRIKTAYLRKVAEEKELVEKLELVMNRTSPWGGALALLRGSRLRRYIHQQRVIVGRRSTTSQPDIDLVEEGNARGVSREHARITLRSPAGQFSVENIGKLRFYVNGQPVGPGDRCPLLHLSFLEIGELKFVFEVNLSRFAAGVIVEDHSKETPPRPRKRQKVEAAPERVPPPAPVAAPSTPKARAPAKPRKARTPSPSKSAPKSVVQTVVAPAPVVNVAPLSAPGQLTMMTVDSATLSRTPVVSSVVSAPVQSPSKR